MAAIAAITMAGAALSAYGSLQQAEAQKNAAQYNADLNTRQATITYQQAAVESDRLRRHQAQVQGAAIAQYGASGVDFEGSPTDVLAFSAAQQQLDLETLNYNANLKAMGYTSNAQLDNMAAKTAVQQGDLMAASSFLTGVGQAATNYGYATKGASISTSPASTRQALGQTRITQ